MSAIAQPSSELKLNVVLVEKMLRYSGENGVRFHPMVVRSWQSARAGEGREFTFDLAAVSAKLKAYIDNFEKKDARHNPDGTFRFAEYRHAMDTANLAVVAYVEDGKSRQVLQAAFVDLAPAGKAGE